MLYYYGLMKSASVVLNAWNNSIVHIHGRAVNVTSVLSGISDNTTRFLVKMGISSVNIYFVVIQLMSALVFALLIIALIKSLDNLTRFRAVNILYTVTAIVLGIEVLAIQYMYLQVLYTIVLASQVPLIYPITAIIMIGYVIGYSALITITGYKLNKQRKGDSA